MKFYLLRHGQTKWNIEGKIQGKTDVLLNEDGMEQAGFLAKAMEHCEARALFSSPLLRAKQTAEIVAGKMGLPVTVLPELKEVDSDCGRAVPGRRLKKSIRMITGGGR